MSFALRAPSRRVRFVAAAGAAAVLAAGLLAAQTQPGHAVPLKGASELSHLGMSSDSSVRVYLRLDGVTPATTSVSDHSNDILLRDFAFGVTKTSGAPSLADFTVTKSIDSTSPTLLSLVTQGTAEATGEIFVVRTNGDGSQAEALEYDLTNVVATSDQQSSTGPGAQETLKLSFDTVTETYYAGFKKKHHFGWDDNTHEPTDN